MRRSDPAASRQASAVTAASAGTAATELLDDLKRCCYIGDTCYVGYNCSMTCSITRSARDERMYSACCSQRRRARGPCASRGTSPSTSLQSQPRSTPSASVGVGALNGWAIAHKFQESTVSSSLRAAGGGERESGDGGTGSEATLGRCVEAALAADERAACEVVKARGRPGERGEVNGVGRWERGGVVMARAEFEGGCSVWPTATPPSADDSSWATRMAITAGAWRSPWP